MFCEFCFRGWWRLDDVLFVCAQAFLLGLGNCGCCAVDWSMVGVLVWGLATVIGARCFRVGGLVCGFVAGLVDSACFGFVMYTSGYSSLGGCGACWVWFLDYWVSFRFG